jgi:murein DD-endopeptidase MepM/ murein hydrolase activator NlpD
MNKISLPTVFDKVKQRPGTQGKRRSHWIPGEDYKEFWQHFYKFTKKHEGFQEVIPGGGSEINPYFGNFGMRYHPILEKPEYFNGGINVSADMKTPIVPIASGVLEYSGYDVVNGYYVMLSHPQITTEDGFVLYSLYMHLRETSVSFSRYQKMLREISMSSYPEVWIPETEVIGLVGDSGNNEGHHPHLLLQCELRKGIDSILIDPAKLLGYRTKNNKTAACKTQEDFMRLGKKDRVKIIDLDLQKYWDENEHANKG